MRQKKATAGPVTPPRASFKPRSPPPPLEASGRATSERASKPPSRTKQHDMAATGRDGGPEERPTLPQPAPAPPASPSPSPSLSPAPPPAAAVDDSSDGHSATHQPQQQRQKPSSGAGHHRVISSRAPGKKRRVLQRIVTGRGTVQQQQQQNHKHLQQQQQRQRQQGWDSGEHTGAEAASASASAGIDSEEQEGSDSDKAPPSSSTTSRGKINTKQQQPSQRRKKNQNQKNYHQSAATMATSGLAGQGLGSSPTTRLEELFSTTTLRESSPRLEEIQQTQNTNNAPTGSSQIPTAPDSLFTRPPPIKDLLQTKTSTDQDAVSIRCQVIHSDVWNPLPNLMREAHIQFLEDFLGLDQDGDQLPPGFVMLDASRPWLLYWCLIGLHCLGSDLAEYRERLIDTLRPIQNRSGGFGGGNGQKSHVAVSYASVLSLCTVGGKEAFDLIDRVSMWRWLSGLKQLDGGFRVCDGGEEDVRGAYCTLTLISLLGLPTELAPEDVKRLAHDSEEMVAGRKMPGYGHDPKNVPKNLLDGVAEYIGRCQTYEGGIAGGPGGMEAHGGYAFCSLAALCLLGEPQKMLSKYLDLPKLISWLSARQYAPEGGFSGRTNKLVDGCYSTWVGGCWALVEAALNGPQEVEEDEGDGVGRRSVPAGQGTDLVGSLWSRDGLVKYILGCCQDSRGGLRDKPGKSPDQYHSAYILLGLSSAQNYQYYVRESSGSTSGTVNGDPDATDDSTSPPTPRAAFQWRTSHYVPKATTATSATGASGGFEREQILSTYDLDDREKVDFLDLPEDDGVGEELGDSGEWWYGNRVRRAHPIFNVPYQRVGEWSKWVWGDEPSVDDNESSSSDS